MARNDQEFKAYVSRRAADIAQAIQSVMKGQFDIELAIEDQEDEHEAEIETLVLGFNMMCAELKRLDEIARHERDRATLYIEQQQATIKKLNTPMIEVWNDILVMPIIGSVDVQRQADMATGLLEAIVSKRVKHVIIDITGIEAVDTFTVDQLLKLVRAAKLLGTRCLLTGVNSSVARTIVQLNINFAELPTFRTLKNGLSACLSGELGLGFWR
jgi:rsbT co-antagonist protein RsbR